MSVKVYQCANCTAGLSFDPASGTFKCDYCGSVFTAAQVGAGEHEVHQAQSEDGAQRGSIEAEQYNQATQLYHCPNCGAEVIAAETTAATGCLYCHNPVVLKGKLEGDHRPEYIIPFAISKEEAQRKFLDWCKNQRMIVKDFYSGAQIELLNGVYYPFWLVDGDASVSMQANARSVRSWRQGDYDYTETSYFDVFREGNYSFGDIAINAVDAGVARQLQGGGQYILNEIQPYGKTKMIPFSMAYLSGFLAEKRRIEKRDAAQFVDNKVRQTGEKLIRGRAGNYTSVQVRNIKVHNQHAEWKYVLMPVWLLTYRYNGEMYYFAMNGETGKIAGRAPINKKRVAGIYALASAGTMLLTMLLGWLL